MPLLNCLVFPAILPVRGNYSSVILCRIRTVYIAGISSEHTEGLENSSLPRKEWPVEKPWVFPKFSANTAIWNGYVKGHTDFVPKLFCHHSHLSSCSVRVDCNFTGAPTMAINCGCHLLPADQSFYFIPRWYKLPAFGFLQRFISKKCIFLHFSSWKLVTNPVRQI